MDDYLFSLDVFGPLVSRSGSCPVTVFEAMLFSIPVALYRWCFGTVFLLHRLSNMRGHRANGAIERFSFMLVVHHKAE